jgi:Ca2+-binding RTX toxin-like protein
VAALRPPPPSSPVGVNSFGPVFSPDGTKIAFLRGGAAAFGLFVMNPDGSGVVDLTATARAGEEDATWSPDGDRIAYTRCGTFTCRLFTMSSSGAHQRPIPHTIRGFDPVWSPDGRLIAFDGNIPGRCDPQILVVRPDGSHLRDLTSCHRGGVAPSWAPNGKRLAFGNGLGVRARIWVVNRDGSHAHPVTSRPLPHRRAPAWSPDGTQIAFSYGDHKGAVVRVDGRDALTILSHSENINWRPVACTITGTSGPDHLVGTAGDDVLCGLGRNDVIAGRGGRDIISGGRGTHDAVSFAWASAGIRVRVARSAAGQGLEFLSGVEDVVGSPFADVIRGDSLANILRGGSGADVIHAGAGSDVAEGGRGNDTIISGVGLDRLYGQRGNDTLNAHDRHGGDLVAGGLGADACGFDRGDRVVGC